MFLQRPEKFTEERTKDNLIRFSMQFITTTVTELWQGEPLFIDHFLFGACRLNTSDCHPPLCSTVYSQNMQMSLCIYLLGLLSELCVCLCVCFLIGNAFSEIDGAFAAGLGWLITFCSDSGGNLY